MKYIKRLLCLTLAVVMALAPLTPAFADSGMDDIAPKGSLVICKEVAGSDIPVADAEFEFTVTLGDAVAEGFYSIDGGDRQPIPEDGIIGLKAGQSARLSELEPGEYTVRESSFDQVNYKSTSFSVNGEEAQNGLVATVTVEAPESSVGGWYTEDGSIAKDEDGYFTYTLTPDMLDSQGNITVDCDPLAEYMEAEMRDYENWSSRNFRVRLVNKTGVPIKYEDYEFDTVNWISLGDEFTASDSPNMKNTSEGSDENSAGYGWGEAWQRVYAMLVGQAPSAGSLAITGFDGNGIRLACAPLRCINPAVVSFFKSNPGYGTLTGNSSTDSAQKVTLLQMNAFPQLIKQSFTFENWQGEQVSLPQDESRSYADFLCAFYGVDSLDDLTVAQKYNVLGTGSKGSPGARYDGQSAITTYYSNFAGTMSNWCIPYTSLEDGTLDYFKNWGFSDARIEVGKELKSGGQEFSADDATTYAYQPDYFLLETDPEVLSMAYDYLYERCIRLTLDEDSHPISESVDNSATSDVSVGGIKEYLDKTDEANANVLSAMNGGNEIADGEVLSLDHVSGYIEVPNAWNQFRYYDFGFKLTFKATADLPASSVTFTNEYEKPTAPSSPETPATPEKPTPSEKPKTELPQTGDSNPAALMGALAVAGVISLFLGFAALRSTRTR